MNRLILAAATGALLLAAMPSFAQTVGPCPGGGGSAAKSPPVPVYFDLGSVALRAESKPKIAEAAATAKARQVSMVCLIGNTDKLGDKAMNEKLALARGQAVAAEMIRDGIPAKNLVIANNLEAFGNLSFGSRDAQEKDRSIVIVFQR